MELRPYQIEDIEFLSKWPNTANFSQQRTGKSPVALKVMEKHGVKRLLIVCPASAVIQWQGECQKWLNKDAVAIYGTKAKKLKAVEEWTEIAVISIDSFKETERSAGLVSKLLAKNPDGIILDEAHRIKNPSSANAMSIFKTIKVPYKMALTGTPAPNKPWEIYSILHWLYPKPFSSKWRFIDLYFEKQKQRSKSGTTYIDIGGFRRGMEKRMQQILQSFSVQRKRAEVMQWLPDKDYERIKLQPSKAQIGYLNELENYFKAGDVRVQGVLDRLIRYRQVCLDPALLDLRGNSPKKDWLIQYFKDYPETPTIVFSKFTSFLQIIEEEFKLKKIKYGIIIGSTPLKKRDQFKKDFQDGKLNILLINIDAGKEALTLDRAEKAIFTDKFPPVGDIEQAEDRFIATTQDKANKPHTIVELIMKDTYDEVIYELLAHRKSETDIINNYRNYKRKED